MPTTRVIMPLPFRKVTTFDVPAWYFDDNAYIETIYDDDFGAFHRDELDEFYKASIDINTTCIYMAEPLGDAPESLANKTASQLKFVLNSFSAGGPLAIPFAALITVDKKAHIERVWDLESTTNLHALRKQEFAIKPNVDSAAVSNFYKVVTGSCSENPQLLFTLERFNSALARGSRFDRIVDLTISLESLISGKEELRYKFGLYNAFIATSAPEERRDCYKLLSTLYDARSGIVHGDTASRDTIKAVGIVENSWSELIRLARSCLNYHVFFMNDRDRSAWDEHLKELVFGTAPRIVE